MPKRRLAILREDDKSERLLLGTLRVAGIAIEDAVVLTGTDQWPLVNKQALDVVVPLGARATEYVLGKRPETNKKGEGFIHEWRGSILPVDEFTCLNAEWYERYIWRQRFEFKGSSSAVIVPSFSPEQVNSQFDLHPWFLLDLQKAGRVLRDGLPLLERREWFLERPAELTRLEGADLIAVDTELDPPIISLTTDSEVHVFDWRFLNASQRSFLRDLLESPKVLKVAHNWTHDHAWLRKVCSINVKRPYFDTLGGAAILNSGLSKDLSPSIASKFTNWPYHKWLVNHDPYVYCGMDGVATYDAYWPMWDELADRRLLSVAEHDHKLLTPLLDMTAFGFKIDEPTRIVVEAQLKDELEAVSTELTNLVKPIVEKQIKRFHKPHLFRVKRKCTCCGGGASQRSSCVRCATAHYADGDVAVTVAERDLKLLATMTGFKTIKAMKASWPPCRQCEASGKIDHDLPFNPDSSDQVADVIYRGLSIRPRRFKGKETVKAAQLDPIKTQHLIINKVIEFSEKRAGLDTVERLTADTDQRLHCVFDPWGTGSGRVAGKEGLVEIGTNPMNIPKEARRFIIPDPGYLFLYPDMNAIEARCVAVISQDQKLLEAFTQPINWPSSPRHGKIDSHTRVQQFLLEEAKIEMTRDAVKRLTYASMYGGAPAQITKEINAEQFRKGLDRMYTEQEIALCQIAFFRIFSGLARYHKSVLEEVFDTRRLRCKLTGRERTWNGRIGDRKTKAVSRETSKEVWSYLPQNMAAWILGLGLIDIYYNSGVYGTLLQPQIHVHDALLMQAPIEQIDLAKDKAISYLSRREWGMDFPAEMHVGSNWLEASGA